MQRPRIKPEHAANRISDGRIRLGGHIYGVAAEVDDPSGAVWTLLESMDGHRDVEQIVSRVRAAHPTESEESVRAGLGTFVGSGYVEDLGAPDPPELTELDKDRYSRSRAYFRWLDTTPRVRSWEPQVALSRARITLIGLGGTGGTAAMALAASGVAQLRCVDPDVVELSNLNRQVLYGEADIGRPKVEAAADRLAQLNSAVDVVTFQERVTGSADVERLVADCDVLVLSADRPTALRRWTNRACLATGTPWVDAGYHGPMVQVGRYVPGVGACWECIRTVDNDHYREIDVNLRDAEPRNEAVADAVAAPTAGISGYLAAHHAMALITGVPSLPAGRIDALNLLAPEATFVRDDPRRPDCPACGTTDAARTGTEG
ncbi:HesA/MoeB/ThiF family protein [Cryptosporangium arvum]|uniref:Dinucleotide-utilizing enzyme possibly involved in molybdopterin or thiamin biosynthesis n=1 Tax=Cryptosporangium arvum DSM 44712 TaxID=927661 RepID=A0A010ZV91_9ACTN|nr:ThiF family adenylyltransferase [Cryptosporangium arvum]EXG81132.1 dinucleotide-utilizing enzyme possibly involved in molybdopterin or thiamin biosynthesis [Cryptosporangium arvum DSM 44712]